MIIEDERLSAGRLRKMILNIDHTLEVEGPLTSVEEVVESLRIRNDYDLIFADIELEDGDVFAAFHEVRPEAFVVFTTAYDQYALQAFRHNGIDYLLKPIDGKELQRAMQKAGIAQRGNAEQVQRAMDEMVRSRKRLLVYKGEELLILQMEDILYFVTEGDGLRCVAYDGEVYHVKYTIQKLKNELDPDCFFRLNRQYLVNIRAIKRVVPYGNGKLKVRLKKCEDDEIYVSKDNMADFKLWMDGSVRFHGTHFYD